MFKKMLLNSLDLNVLTENSSVKRKVLHNLVFVQFKIVFSTDFQSIILSLKNTQ